MKTKLVLAALAAFSSILLSSAVADDKPEWGKITDDEIAYTLPDKFSDEAAAILFDQGELEIPQPYEDNRIHLKIHRRCKIFDVDGADDAITEEIYLPPGEKIRDLKAQTISADGKHRTEVKGDDIHKQTSGDYEIITFTFPAVENGCFVEYRYELRHQRFLSLSSWYFQNDLFTHDSHFSVVVHKGFDYSVAMRNIPEELQKPERNSLFIWGDKCAEYIWDLKDLPPVRPEPYMPALQNYRASLSFQLVEFADQYNVLKFADHWSSLGEEVDAALNHVIKAKGDIKDTTRAVLARFSGGSRLDTLKCIFDYVRNNYQTEDDDGLYLIDYTDTDYTLKNQKGTIAGKNLLLIEMLQSAGIDAKPLLIGTRDYCKFDPQVFHLSQFNYLLCIASVDSAYYFLDTKDKYAAFPFLPPECMAEGGLIIDGDNSKPVKLTHAERPSAVNTKARIFIGNDGAAVCSTHVALSGHFLSKYRNLLDKDIDEGNVKETLIENAEDIELDVNTALVKDYSEDDSVTVDLVIDLPDFCQRVENNLVFEPLLYAPRENPFEKSERTYPVDFNFKYSYHVETDITVGNSLTLVSLPPQVQESMNGLQFNRVSFGGGREARVISQLLVNKKIFEASEYPTLRSTFEKIAQAGLERSAAEIVVPSSAGN